MSVYPRKMDKFATDGFIYWVYAQHLRMIFIELLHSPLPIGCLTCTSTGNVSPAQPESSCNMQAWRTVLLVQGHLPAPHLQRANFAGVMAAVHAGIVFVERKIVHAQAVPLENVQNVRTCPVIPYLLKDEMPMKCECTCFSAPLPVLWRVALPLLRRWVHVACGALLTQLKVVKRMRPTT